MSSSDSSSSDNEIEQKEVATKKVVEQSGDELEIDLNKPEPLSKKQKRLLKKGKINEDKTGEVKLSKKAKKELASNDDLLGNDDSSSKPDGEENEADKKNNKSEFSVWIGNMSFDTTADDIKRFLVAKTANNDDKTKAIVTTKDITRLKLPLAPGSKHGGKKPVKIRGFAYVDFKTQLQAETVVALSEECLNGRNLLIKDSKSFEGRPAVVTAKGGVAGTALSKNPPSRILFVGNLAFDTKDETLEQHFQHCGEIIRVRMATFEDSGNCKGFAFIDFRDIEGATAALKDKSCRKLAGRVLRMEFGEDRSKRTKQDKSNLHTRAKPAESYDNNNSNNNNYHNEDREYNEEPKDQQRKPKRKFEGKKSDSSSNKRLKPGLALATAQRAKISILPSAGKKITFD
jgi:RNA recognition motif-containing protein